MFGKRQNGPPWKWRFCRSLLRIRTRLASGRYPSKYTELIAPSNRKRSPRYRLVSAWMICFSICILTNDHFLPEFCSFRKTSFRRCRCKTENCHRWGWFEWTTGCRNDLTIVFTKRGWRALDLSGLFQDHRITWSWRSEMGLSTHQGICSSMWSDGNLWKPMFISDFADLEMESGKWMIIQNLLQSRRLMPAAPIAWKNRFQWKKKRMKVDISLERESKRKADHAWQAPFQLFSEDEYRSKKAGWHQIKCNHCASSVSAFHQQVLPVVMNFSEKTSQILRLEGTGYLLQGTGKRKTEEKPSFLVSFKRLEKSILP